MLAGMSLWKVLEVPETMGNVHLLASPNQSVLKRETRAGQEPGESPLSGKVVRAAAGGQARSPAYNLRPVSQMKHRRKVSGREAVGPLCPRPRQNAIAFMVGVQAKAGCLEGRDWKPSCL